MLCALSLAICLQSSSQLKLQELWSIGPTLSCDGNQVSVGKLVKGPDDRTLSFLTSSVRGAGSSMIDHLCDIDVETGKISVVNSVPDILFSLNADGLLLGKGGVLDRQTLEPIFTFPNHGDNVIHGNDLTQYTLPKKIYAIDNIGRGMLIWDSGATRLVSFGGEVRSFKPHTWQQDRILISKDSLLKRFHVFYGMDPEIVGDPDKGAFCLNYGSGCFCFTANRQLIQSDSFANCYDAGERGLLIEGSGLLCLDAKTGLLKWKQEILKGFPRWVGNYVVAATIARIQRKSDEFATIYDGDTGEDVGTLAFPLRHSKIVKAVGDILIFQAGSQCMACRIVNS